MSANPRTRAGGALGHLLLVVVLAFGVFSMHTMGHPKESSASGMDGMVHAVAADPHRSPEADETGVTEAPAAPADLTEQVADLLGTSADEPFAGMDLMSVCMAVLSVWLLALYLRAASARRSDWPEDLLTRVIVLVRPNPPPRRPDLAQLSVLRI